MILSSKSDKAVLELARKGDVDAAHILFKRWAVKPTNEASVMEGWRGLKTLSVTAAKRIALSG